jgi:octaprenyl-diphosphate synthase
MDTTLIAPTRNGKSSRSSLNLPDLLGDELDQVEGIFREALAPYRDRFPVLIERLSAYHGKRLRPMLLLLVAKAFGEVQRSHLLLAASIEMIHTATLVHDDVLDEAELRRHRPTINSRFGNKISILLGDLLFSTAFHLSSQSGDAEACEAIGEATNRVCAGELHQTLETGNLDLTEEAYFQIIEGKTAALTECAARLGARYAGADPEAVEAMAAYGRSLGIAFQIADDLLDLIGDPEQVGKTLGTDLQQGKMTLPLIYLFDRLPESDGQRLKTSLLRGDEEARGELVDLLHKTHALQDTRRTALQQIAEAQRQLVQLPRNEFRLALEGIAEWSLSRER